MSSPYGQHARSLYVPQSRPVIPRQRSNSLPPGLAMMNAEEAGMLFSAAEKATARRRRAKSIHHAALPDSPPASDEDSPLSTSTAFKPSPLRQTTAIRASLDKPLPEPPIATPNESVGMRNTSSQRRPPSEIRLPENFLQTLPVSPLSPKRQVTSKSLKSYADGLFNFTHNVLTSTIPVLQIEVPHSPIKSTESRELASPINISFRPLLESKFSDWSVNTGAQQSRRDSLAVTPIDLNPTLLSPDSFFSVDVTPKRSDFNLNMNRYSGVSFASSETYEPPSSLPPLTPPSRSPLLAEDNEISYFTNFDQYLDYDNWPLRTQTPPESIAVDLSPLELDCAQTAMPLPIQRKRPATSMRIPARSAPLLRSNAPPTWSRPSTPYQLADLALVVPNPVIRAIG